MVNKTVLSLIVGLALVFAIAAPMVSAGWKELYVANTVLQNSDNYDIVWQGPYKGGTLFVSSNGGKGNSALDGVDLNGDYDVLTYQKNNYVDYSGYGNTGYGRSYNPGLYRVGFSNYRSNYGSYNTNYASDRSETLVIDKTNSNRLKDNQDARDAALESGNYHPAYDPARSTWSWRY